MVKLSVPFLQTNDAGFGAFWRFAYVNETIEGNACGHAWTIAENMSGVEAKTQGRTVVQTNHEDCPQCARALEEIESHLDVWRL